MYFIELLGDQSDHRIRNIFSRTARLVYRSSPLHFIKSFISIEDEVCLDLINKRFEYENYAKIHVGCGHARFVTHYYTPVFSL